MMQYTQREVKSTLCKLSRCACRLHSSSSIEIENRRMLYCDEHCPSVASMPLASPDFDLQSYSRKLTNIKRDEGHERALAYLMQAIQGHIEAANPGI